MPQADESSEESRTLAIGSKISRNKTESIVPSKRPRNPPHISRRSIGRRHLQDLVPKGRYSSQEASAVSVLRESQPSLDRSNETNDTSDSSSHFHIHQRSFLTSILNGKGSRVDSVTTLVPEAGDRVYCSSTTSLHPRTEGLSSNRMSTRNVVEISDESDVGDDSEGGILLNVDGPSWIDSPIRVDTSDEDSEDEYDPMSVNNTVIHASGTANAYGAHHASISKPPSKTTTTPNTSSRNSSAVTSRMFRVDTRQSDRTLAVLNPEDLERQIKYALFHLRRDQIDLSRPVVCLSCLTEGHSDDHCPALFCTSCRGLTKHPSRLCPKCARCSKCGARGHDVDDCSSKLRNTALEPCEFCGGVDHVEASCTQRFFPARSQRPSGELQLWISCARCGSKEHLAGDCATFSSRSSSVWSLRSCGYSRESIVNLSLQRGIQAREKEAEGKGLRPEGMEFSGPGAAARKGYAKRGEATTFLGSQFDQDDEDFTSRIARNKPGRPPPARKPSRFGDKGGGYHDHSHQADRYQARRFEKPSTIGDMDPHRPPPYREYHERSSYRGNRDRQYHDERDRRQRSRSPRLSFEELDTWRPPLPREPPPQRTSLPTRSAQSYSQQQQQEPQSNLGEGRSLSKTARRKAAKEHGSGGSLARPTPFAGKKPWKQGRP